MTEIEVYPVITQGKIPCFLEEKVYKATHSHGNLYKIINSFNEELIILVGEWESGKAVECSHLNSTCEGYWEIQNGTGTCD